MRNTTIAASRGRFITDAGSPIHQLYSSELQPDGDIKLIPTGTENTDEIIQSYYESTTLECILSKFANGDMTALNRYQPIYMDVTKGPKNLAESMQLLIDAENAFAVLPVEIKQQFNNDFRNWILTSQDKEWAEKMAPIITPLNNNNIDEAGRVSPMGEESGSESKE